MVQKSRKIQQEVKEKIKNYKKRIYTLTAIVAVFLFFIIAFIFRIPGITMENKLICTLEEHIHTVECIPIDGGIVLEEHIHNELCYENNFTCLIEEHTHNEECSQVESGCQIKEHVHSEECSEYSLICLLQEHVTKDNQYQLTEKCTLEEHLHGQSCYELEDVVNPNEQVKPEDEEVQEGEKVPEEGKGHVHIKISEQILENVSIDARVVFIGKGEYSNSPYKGQFKYEIKDKDGNEKESGIADFKELSWDGKDGGYLFKGLAQGDSLKILNVPATDVIYGATNVIVAKVIATSSNEFYPVIYTPAEEIDLKILETIEFQVSLGEIEEPKLPTKNTFKDIGGKYEINYILENYNVFSFEDIEGTHIVGPIIAKNKSYRSSGFGEPKIPVDSIKVADLTKGISSYVGSVDKIVERDLSKLNASYIYDIDKNSEFRKPTLYVNLKDNMVRKESGIYYFFTKDGEKYLAANDFGLAYVLQNDSFIDFENARKQFNDYSSILAKAEDNVEVSPDHTTGRLNIEVGRNYIIKDTSRLREVNLIYPEPYDPIYNPFPVETIINISDNSLLKSGEKFGEYTYPFINGQVHYFFPNIYVNDNEFNGALGQGEGFEFGSSNNIIFNLPNINTDNGGQRVVKQVETDILGHIIAPNAEFWNYSEGFDGIVRWEGGNINGCAIVDSWHAGKMESHMWPYRPNDLPIDIAFTKKDVSSNKVLPGAEFELIQVQSTTNHKPLVDVKVIKAISDENGVIKFKGIDSYSVYKLTEVKAPDGYNKPEGYWIVEVSGYGSTLKINVTNYGNVHLVENDLVIYNKKINFTIHKVDQVTNDLLPGAIFDLYLANEKGEPVGDPLIKNITTGDDGKIKVESELLKYDTLYVLVETKAPKGYINKGNIPFYIMGTEGLFKDVENKVAIGSDGILTVTNAKEGYVLPETGGQGILIYYIVGGFMVVFASMAFNKKIVD